MLEVIDSKQRSAKEHMLFDKNLLQGVSRPVLHFYEFAPLSITYGYFINPSDWIVESTENVARRPTGGGLIFHDNDFSFTIALPIEHPLAQKPVLDRYQIINNQTLKVLKGLFPSSDLSLMSLDDLGGLRELCMANPVPYDLMMGRKKVGGAAQRKNRHAFIHQCSLFLKTPSFEIISNKLIDPNNVLNKIQQFTSGILVNEQKNIRSEIKMALHRAMLEII